MNYYHLMMFLVDKTYLRFLVVFCVFVIISCARKGRPDGGPRDLTPPVLLRSNPDTLSTNVPTDIDEITLYFDEYVTLKDANKNIIVSPPITPSPIFTPSGTPDKEVNIRFSELLNDDTTYTINFGQSIQDNNEGNTLPYYTYVFSTGDHIDSLELSGSINNLGERKMPEDVIAALYRIDSAYTDSLIYTQKPLYVAKVDSTHQFHLKYLKEGRYKLIAFNDATPNMKFDARNEKFAFYPEIVEAGSEQNYDLNLFTPSVDYRAQEVIQADYGKLQFVFVGNPETVKIIPLEPKFTTSKIEHKAFSDTLLYYFNPSVDSLSEKRVRMKFAVEHNNQIDSIPPVLYDTEKYTALKVYGRNLNYSPGKVYEIEANYPLDTLNKEYITVKKDSVDMDFAIKRLKSNRFGLDFPIDYKARYKIELLPGAALDYMQRTNDTLNVSFGVKDEKEFGKLKLNIINAPQSPFWLKLMNTQDKEVANIYGTETTHVFENLNPGDYYFKLIVDENSNGRYDTGNWYEAMQPEPIYIYKSNVTVRAYWEIEESWVLGESPTTDSNNQNTPEPKKVPIQDLRDMRP